MHTNVPVLRSNDSTSSANASAFQQAPSRFPWRLFSRFITGQLIFVILLLVTAGVSARTIFRDWFFRQASAQAHATLVSLSRDLNGDLTQWCAGHSSGVFTFALIKTLPQPSVPICSNIPFARANQEDADIRRAAQGFGTTLIKDEHSALPVLLASLNLRDKGLVLRTAMPLQQLQAALLFFDRSLVGTLLILAAAFAAFSAWTGRRLIFPLGRLLLKAQKVGEGEIETDKVYSDDEGIDSESAQGEWSDLETTIDQIRHNLRSKTETLTREREELATLMSAISDAILAVDKEGNPLFYNSRFALFFGERDLATRRPRLGELFRSPEVLDAFHSALASGQAQTAESRLHVGQDPVPRYFSISVAPLRRPEGKVYGAVGIFHDITELKRAEQIRIDFVANVSHELRTPLTSIKGFADTLRADLKEGRTETSENFLDVIHRNTERLMSLISDLLDLSSIESSAGSEVVKTPLDTRDLTARVLGQLEAIRTRKNHNVETQFGAETVNAQAGRVEQVLTNLLENAMKYVPQGGLIRVVWERPIKGKGVLLRVADSGPGIPPEHQSRLFERFYRIDKARSRELGGTGLGLAIVKHIMQVHGGSVYVTSEPGKGAEFVCQFPE